MLTEVCSVSASNPDPKIISQAAEAIQNGKLVVFPTETVYGIAAHALDPKVLLRLSEVKNRPQEKHYTWHVASISKIKEEIKVWPKWLESFLKEFWPGPLTVIVEVKVGGTRGFRMPNHEVALALIRECQVPIVAPSANLSQMPAPTDAKEVLVQLEGKVDLVLDAGKTQLGSSSTVLDLSQKKPKILRAGAISEETINRWFERSL